MYLKKLQIVGWRRTYVEEGDRVTNDYLLLDSTNNLINLWSNGQLFKLLTNAKKKCWIKTKEKIKIITIKQTYCLFNVLSTYVNSIKTRFWK